MSFQQGLSGLNAASKNLEVIGNNVANASTVGFKQSQAVFADVYARSLSSGGGAQVGIGTKMSQVVQQFTQGNVSTTNNPLDLSINGDGFFCIEQNGTPAYTRNGQFYLDDEGYIVNTTGAYLKGYQVNANGAVQNSGNETSRLKMDFSDLPPRATENAELVINLDSRSQPINITPLPDPMPVPPPDPMPEPPVPFDAANPASYHYTTSVPVYDSLGNMYSLQTYYARRDTGWDVYAAFDGQVLNGGGVITQHQFDANGKLSSPTGIINLQLTPPDAAVMNVQLNFNKMTQFGSGSNAAHLHSDGYMPGRLAGFSIGSDGTILGRYTNGESAVLGAVALTTFTNVNGLEPLGDNNWAETPNSGPPNTGIAGTGTLGMLRANTVEESNVDLTAELVRMITAQRNYQANAQTIKTQDQVMQTLVNMR